MNSRGEVHFRDPEKHMQRQGGMHNNVHLGSYTSSMLLGCEVRLQDWQEDGGWEPHRRGSGNHPKTLGLQVIRDEE